MLKPKVVIPQRFIHEHPIAHGEAFALIDWQVPIKIAQLAEFMPQLADKHFAHSYPNLISDSYEGGHWLGSFAIQPLNQSQAH